GRLEHRSQHLGLRCTPQHVRTHPGRLCLFSYAAKIDLVICPSDGGWPSDLHNLAPLHQHGPVTEAFDRAHVVRYEHDRFPLTLEPNELVKALLLKRRVPHGEDL